MRLTIIILMFIGVQGLLAQTANLTIEVSNIKPIESSTIMLAVYQNEEAFLKDDQIYKKVSVPVSSSVMVYTFNDLQYGTYAVSLYHDEDNDKEMDRKWYGPPKEGYGFSNNFTSNVRPARFDDASFELSEDKKIHITVVY